MDFTTILNELRIGGPAGTVPDDLREDYLLQGLQDLCRKTFAYTEVLTFLTTAGTREYTLSPSDSDTEIIGLTPGDAQIATLNTPVPSAAAYTDAGTLVDSTTYSYKVTAIKDDYGETLPSTACTAAADANGSIQISWSAISGADGYRIYGRTDSSWLLMDETTSLSWVDDGSETPSGAIPTESQLMKEIEFRNTQFESIDSRYWRGLEGDNITGLIYDGMTAVKTNRIPTTTGIGFQVRVALYPTAEIAIPTIIEPYVPALKDYVRERLFEMVPSAVVTWSNPQLAEKFGARYRRARSRLKTSVIARFAGRTRAKPQFFV